MVVEVRHDERVGETESGKDDRLLSGRLSALSKGGKCIAATNLSFRSSNRTERQERKLYPERTHKKLVLLSCRHACVVLQMYVWCGSKSDS